MKKPSDIQKLRTFQKTVGYRFKRPRLLTLALTHRSFAFEAGKTPQPDNERLEFLGDSVLGLVIAKLAYKSRRKFSEGMMTQIKSNLVSRAALARKGRQIKLGPMLHLGKGQSHKGKLADSIISCGFEALIGAIYLDGGISPATRFIKNHVWPKRTHHPKPIANHKEQLQKLFLERYQKLPIYRVVKQKGPAHRKEFTLAIFRNGRTVAKGVGSSKKEAGQLAARNALRKLKKKKR